jgi:hypothetical protein
MTESKPFSTVNYLARHEVGMSQVDMVIKWRDTLVKVVQPGYNRRTDISDTRHFEVELRRVNRWLRNINH